MKRNVRPHPRGRGRPGRVRGSAYAQQTVKIGLLATLEGPFAAGGADGMRGAELAIKQRNGMAGGKKIEIIKASSDAKPDVAVNATRKLVEQDKVDIMVGPLSGGEGIAVKDYSKTQPNVTFINGGSGAQATTLVNPSPNFFRFNTEGGAVDGGPRQGGARQGLQARHGDRRGLRVPVLAGAGLHGRVLPARRQGAGQGLGAARRQGLRLGDRAHPEGRRRAGGGAGRRRCGELPQPVRGGGRRQADDRRIDHREPGRPELQGQAPGFAGRHLSPARRSPTPTTRPSSRPSSPTTRRTTRFGPTRARRCSRSSTTST